MIFDAVKEGYVLRVRLTPNSSSCHCGGVYTSAEGKDYLKVCVNSVPEKGKANQELLKLLAKGLKTAKSNLKIISGETDRCKKILITGETAGIAEKLTLWAQEER